MHRRSFLAAIGLSPLGLLPATAATAPRKSIPLEPLTLKVSIAFDEQWETSVQGIGRIARLDPGQLVAFKATPSRIVLG